MTEADERMEDRKPAVLIVDDEPSICDLLAEVLDEQGYHCETAGNAVEALVKLKERTFELALLDYKMPGMSGMDLLTAIAESYPNTTTIMVALRRGARAYILKPFTLDEIREQVATIVKGETS